jgi:hypothetical protein
LNPERLSNKINSNLEQLWILAEYPTRSVTRNMRQ